jgi:potassium-transporting ATPase KdpC subunit
MKTVIVSLKIFLFFTVLTGVIYPLFVTGIAQALFPGKANGSLVTKNGKTIGSKWIGQLFDSTVYFSSRPSAVSYNPLPSGGSNFGLTSRKLDSLFRCRKEKFETFNQLPVHVDLPPEMLFASASGLDPHISPRAALLQVDRVAKARNYTPVQHKELEQLVKKQVEARQMVVLGEPRVNVLLLNLKLDQMQ